MIAVLATREGLQGQKTSVPGYTIDPVTPFVALPSVAALHQWVQVYNPATQKFARALVLDVGPWNTHDHTYVFQPATLSRSGLMLDANPIRPASEFGQSLSGSGKTNGAGIDLGEAVWRALGMTDNAIVWWEFL